MNKFQTILVYATFTCLKPAVIDAGQNHGLFFEASFKAIEKLLAPSFKPVREMIQRLVIK
jgi:hypothetical protein